MGNSASSQRPNILSRHGWSRGSQDNPRQGRSQSPIRSTTPLPAINESPPLAASPSSSSSTPAVRRANAYGTFQRRVSTQSIPLRADGRHPIQTDEIVYEQEERPLMNMQELGMQNAPITHIAAAPIPRRASTMSRLGSRILPNSVARNLLSSGEETAAEGRALRRGLTSRPPVVQRRLSHQGNRFSIRDSWRSIHSSTSSTRRQTIRGPFPLMQAPGQLLHDDPIDIASNSSMMALDGDDDLRENNGSSWSRRTRSSRFRRSLPAHFSNFFGSSLGDGSEGSRLTPMRPSRSNFVDDSDHLLRIPPLTDVDTSLHMGDPPHELDAVEPETRNLLSATRSTTGTRRLGAQALRSTSRSRIMRRSNDQPQLSHILQLAAAAIAAQLSGQGSPSTTNMQPVAGEGWDGTIQNFVQTLQDAATAQASESLEGTSGDGPIPPVNFYRVFQFPNTDLTNRNSDMDSDPRDTATGAENNDEIDDNGNLVTLVLVGVRSMPSASDDGVDGHNFTPSLDSLLNLNMLPPSNLLRHGSSGALFRRPDTRSRINSRRNSLTNFHQFPEQYSSQRHQRTRSTTTTRSATEQNSLSPPSNILPTVLSESPPGPHPPPSTPADLRSGAGTPSRRPSSASIVHTSPLPHLSENPSSTETSDRAPLPSHQRRHSHSEHSRRAELGSGASRRNGVVEPTANVPGGRSWLIYVVGTNVSSDHPAFTMPSLFTDNPSYEDMALLSTLLGPAKPPVATQEDVNTSGGLFVVSRDLERDVLIASPREGTRLADIGTITLAADDRCLICLGEYEVAGMLRQLNSCRHMFHGECIDVVSGISSWTGHSADNTDSG